MSDEAEISDEDSNRQVLVAVLDGGGDAERAAMTQELCDAGIFADQYAAGTTLEEARDHADQGDYDILVAVGPDDFAQGVVPIVDLTHGREFLDTEAFEHDRRAWLEAIPGQIRVTRECLVVGVLEILNRYQSH